MGLHFDASILKAAKEVGSVTEWVQQAFTYLLHLIYHGDKKNLVFFYDKFSRNKMPKDLKNIS